MGTLAIQEIKVKSVLTKSNLPVSDYSVNPYVGCTHGCKYCYANDSKEAVKRRRAVYDADSPLLCGTVEEGDRITVRRTARIRSGE